LDALRGIEGRPGRVSADAVPLELVGGQWRRLVLASPQLGDGELDRRAYSFCVLEALQRALDRHDVFVARSGRYSDPRAKLLMSGTSNPGERRQHRRDARLGQQRLREFGLGPVRRLCDAREIVHGCSSAGATSRVS
jgi:hypothetical protein